MALVPWLDSIGRVSRILEAQIVQYQFNYLLQDSKMQHITLHNIPGSKLLRIVRKSLQSWPDRIKGMSRKHVSEHAEKVDPSRDISQETLEKK